MMMYLRCESCLTRCISNVVTDVKCPECGSEVLSIVNPPVGEEEGGGVY